MRPGSNPVPSPDPNPGPNSDPDPLILALILATKQDGTLLVEQMQGGRAARARPVDLRAGYRV